MTGIFKVTLYTIENGSLLISKTVLPPGSTVLFIRSDPFSIFTGVLLYLV